MGGKNFYGDARPVPTQPQRQLIEHAMPFCPAHVLLLLHLVEMLNEQIHDDDDDDDDDDDPGMECSEAIAPLCSEGSPLRGCKIIMSEIFDVTCGRLCR